MLKACKPCTTGLGIQEVFDLNNRGHGLLGIAKELEADGAGVAWHAMQDPTTAGDQAIATFLLNARKSTEDLVGDIFAQAQSTKAAPFNLEFFLRERLANEASTIALASPVAQCTGVLIGPVTTDAKCRPGLVVDLAHAVANAGDFEPVAIGVDHAPRRKVVDGRAPEHGLLATGIHGDISTHTGGIGRGWVHRKDQPCCIGGIGHAPSHHARTGIDGSHGIAAAGQDQFLDRTQ